MATAFFSWIGSPDPNSLDQASREPPRPPESLLPLVIEPISPLEARRPHEGATRNPGSIEKPPEARVKSSAFKSVREHP
jgi:hypothetical protein